MQDSTTQTYSEEAARDILTNGHIQPFLDVTPGSIEWLLARKMCALTASEAPCIFNVGYDSIIALTTSKLLSSDIDLYQPNRFKRTIFRHGHKREEQFKLEERWKAWFPEDIILVDCDHLGLYVYPQLLSDKKWVLGATPDLITFHPKSNTIRVIEIKNHWKKSADTKKIDLKYAIQNLIQYATIDKMLINPLLSGYNLQAYVIVQGADDSQMCWRLEPLLPIFNETLVRLMTLINTYSVLLEIGKKRNQSAVKVVSMFKSDSNQKDIRLVCNMLSSYYKPYHKVSSSSKQ